MAGKLNSKHSRIWSVEKIEKSGFNADDKLAKALFLTQLESRLMSCHCWFIGVQSAVGLP
jgi:hypothetical protein